MAISTVAHVEWSWSNAHIFFLRHIQWSFLAEDHSESKISSKKHKSAKNMAVNTQWTGYFFTVWELKQENSMGFCELEDYKFLPLCTCL